MGYGDHYAFQAPTELGKKSKLLLNSRFLARLTDQCDTANSRRILEIGAGHGFFAQACIDAGHEFHAVEPNPRMCEWLAARDYSVKQATCPPIPHASDQFDVVYAGYVLEFLHDPNVAFEFVAECKRVLKPRGIVGFVSSNYLAMGKEFWNVSYMTNFATTEKRVRHLLFDCEISFVKTVLFSGNLFGMSRLLPQAFYKVYNYRILEMVFRQRHQLDSRFYKFRVTFPEGFLVIGRKE